MSAEEKEELLAEMEVVNGEIVKLEGDLGEDDDDDDDDDADDEEKMDEKLAGWAKRREKYSRYVDKGKVEKLERVVAKQEAKLQKAKDKEKPEKYIAYKAAKVEWSKKAVKAASLVVSLKKAGLA